MSSSEVNYKPASFHFHPFLPPEFPQLLYGRAACNKKWLHYMWSRIALAGVFLDDNCMKLPSCCLCLSLAIDSPVHHANYAPEVQ